jgi:integrase/recombinase XerD
METIDTSPAVTGTIHPLSSLSDPLRRAVAGYLARFKGQSRVHTESDLRCYMLWCEDQRLDPFEASRGTP